MTKIKRDVIRGIKTAEQGKETISYCPRCKPRQLMKERIYEPDEFGKIVIPWDYDYWRQCHRCGIILPIYNLKGEGRLKSELVPVTNPFDKGKAGAIEPNRIGKNRKNRKQDEYDWIGDTDLRHELRHGTQLISYSES
jgi:hypothetical protein